MKVKGYEIEGSTEYWAEQVFLLLRERGGRASFLITRVVCYSPALAHIDQDKRWNVAKRIVDRALQNGRKIGNLVYDGKIWRANTGDSNVQEIIDELKDAWQAKKGDC